MSRPQDLTPLTEVQRELAGRYLPFAKRIARPYQVRWPSERDEFESAAGLAMVEAARAFDAGRGVKFATFAAMRVDGMMRDVQRRLFRPKAALAGNFEGVEDAALADRSASIEAAQDWAEFIRAWLGRLSDRDAYICSAIYFDGTSQESVAATLRTSRSRVKARLDESLQLLRDMAGRPRHAPNSKDQR